MGAFSHEKHDKGGCPMHWSQDVLGAEFSVTHAEVPGSGLHKTISVVRHNLKPESTPRGAVLYVHGWSDYFANPEIASAATEAGFYFYALDLHGYGRNLTDQILATGEVPGTTSDLRNYTPDFLTAREIIANDIREKYANRLVVIAHSTGGLTMSLILMENPGYIKGLALATPWIAPQGFPWLDTAISTATQHIPDAWSNKPLPIQVNTNYHRSLSADRDGTWELDPRWRPRESFPLTINFLRSTANARLTIKELSRQGHKIDAPVLLQIAAKSRLVPWWEEQMHTLDTVLDVKAIRRRAALLHPTVRVITYDGAIHDVHRSAPYVRQRAFKDLQDWLSTLPLG